MRIFYIMLGAIFFLQSIVSCSTFFVAKDKSTLPPHRTFLPPEGVKKHIHIKLGVPLVEASVNGKEGFFLLDTGSSKTILTKAFARKIMLSNQVGLQAHSFSMHVDTLKIGEAVYQDFQVMIEEMDHLLDSRFLGKRLAGIIGGNILNVYPYTIDLKRKLLFIHTPRKLFLPGDCIPIHKRNNRWFVTIPIDGKPCRFLLDTGMTFSTLSTVTADKITKKKTVGTLKGHIADFRSSKKVAPRLIEVVLELPFSPKKEIFSVGLNPYYNILGTDFLDDYVMRIDPKNGRGYLYPLHR